MNFASFVGGDWVLYSGDRLGSGGISWKGSSNDISSLIEPCGGLNWPSSDNLIDSNMLGSRGSKEIAVRS
jgi:hypothetical protein